MLDVLVSQNMKIHAITENDVRAIEPRSRHRGDEELGSVGVFPGIGHGQNARLSMLKLEVLIWKEEVKLIVGQVEFLR